MEQIYLNCIYSFNQRVKQSPWIHSSQKTAISLKYKNKSPLHNKIIQSFIKKNLSLLHPVLHYLHSQHTTTNFWFFSLLS